MYFIGYSSPPKKTHTHAYYKRGVEEGAHEAMEDASRLSAEAGGQVKGAGEEALDGAIFLCVFGVLVWWLW